MREGSLWIEGIRWVYACGVSGIRSGREYVVGSASNAKYKHYSLRLVDVYCLHRALASGTHRPAQAVYASLRARRVQTPDAFKRGLLTCQV